jgi:hypothetical protein
MANCSIPNSSPESGRISRRSSRRLRRQNNRPRAALSVISRLESRIQKRQRVRHGESVLWRTAALQTAARAQKIQSTIGNLQPRPGIAETEGKAATGSGERARAASEFQSAIWRVKGAWWPSRSSKPSSPRSAGRGRFDSYPLRLFIFDCRLSIADCHVVTALRAVQQLHEGGEPYVTRADS